MPAGFRKGDNAPLALVSLMDRTEESAEAQAGDDKKAEKKPAKKKEAKAAA